MELQPERPEGNRRRAKLHLGKIYFFKNSFIFGEKTFEKIKSYNFQLFEVLKKQGLYHSRKEFMNHWYCKSERNLTDLTDNCKKRFNHNLSRDLKIKGNFSRHGKST